MIQYKRAQLSFEEIIGVYTGDHFTIHSMLNDVYEIKNKYPESDGKSNYGGWQKQILNGQNHPIKEVIKNEFKEYIKYYCVKEPAYIDFTSLFCNINPPGSSNVMHHHFVGEFSGVLWIQAEQNSGNLIIMNPFYNRFMNNHMRFSEKDYNAMYINPEPNKGVFFNSNLVHYVDINRSQKDRVSIAYNIDMRY